MLILLGYLVVLGTVFGGYLMTGGSLGALYQPAELVIIAGAGVIQLAHRHRSHSKTVSYLHITDTKRRE